jgi:taurine---2-oxoglutarate transaminase
MTALSATDILKLDRDHVFHPWRRQRDRSSIVVTGGEGCYFIDSTGKRYLDFHSGWGHMTLGHQPQPIIDAVAAQLAQFSNIMPGFAHAPAAQLGACLAEIAPAPLTKSFFATGGTEGIDIAVKMARAYTGRHKIIARYRSYHGNNYGAGVLSGDPRRIPLEPGMPGVVHALDCYCYRCPFKLSYPQCEVHCAEHIGQLIELEGPDTVAAVLAEPVVASNGGLVPPDEYWPKLRAICDRYGVLLIADEVVTGIGRTGAWFACDHWQVVPDIVVLAKGLSAGILPLSATLVTDAIADFFEANYLDAGLTYQSHPLSCAAGIATIRFIQAHGLVEHARRLGQYLHGGLQALQMRHPSIGDVRGLGLYATLELVSDRATRTPLIPWSSVDQPNSIAQAINLRLMARGVKVALRWNRLAMAPPLIIDEAGIDEGLAAIDYALEVADEACR